MHFIRKWIILLLFFATSLVFAEMETLSGTIEKARTQSVLTQKMLANYIMLGMHNTFQNTEKNLQKSIEIFERHIEELDAFATSKKAFVNIEKIMQSWDPIKTMLLEEKSQKRAMVLFDKLELMLALTRETTEIYTRQTGSMLGKIIDASADIGISAQRMATLYLLKAWKIKEKKVETSMKRSMEIFKKSMEMLKQAKINTIEIQRRLKKIERAFMYFSVMNRLDSTAIPTLIYKKSDTILENANILSSLYNKTITLN